MWVWGMRLERCWGSGGKGGGLNDDDGKSGGLKDDDGGSGGVRDDDGKGGCF